MNADLVIKESHKHVTLIGDQGPIESRPVTGSNIRMFTPVDVAFFASEGLRKSNEVLERTNSKFKFYIDTRPTASLFKVQEDLRDIIKNDKLDGLTPVVYTNNLSPINHLPLTAWILTHRIPHTRLFSREMVPNFVESIHRAPVDSVSSFRDDCMAVAKKTMTMRSARLGTIGHHEDILSELFTQHLMGGIRINQDVDLNEVFPASGTPWNNKSQTRKVANWKARLPELQEKLTDHMNRLVSGFHEQEEISVL